MAGGNERTLRLGGVHIDETDMQPREGLSALHIDDVGDHPRMLPQELALDRAWAGIWDLLGVMWLMRRNRLPRSAPAVE